MLLLKKIMLLNLLLLAGLVNSVGAQQQLQQVEQQPQQQSWTTFTADENGFAVDFPNKPTHINQSIDVPKTNMKINYTTYVSEPNESVVYVVSVWHYPKEIDMSRPEVNLKDGFSGMLSALPGSTVVSQEVKDFQGFKALEFLVKNEDIYFQGKLILVYNTLYQVFTVYKETEVEKMKKNYDRFAGSFKLLNPQRNKVETKEAKASKMNV